MKTKILQILFIFLLLTVINQKSFSIGIKYRSITSGNYNSTSTWEMSVDFGPWIPATSTPTPIIGTLTVVRSPHTVTVNQNVSADQFVIEGGATLSINTGIVFSLVLGSDLDFTLSPGGTVLGPGTFQALGSTNIPNLVMNLTEGSPFLCTI